MRSVRCCFFFAVLVGGFLIGCSRVHSPATGARECVERFYEAFIQQDWPRAYAVLDPESQGRCSQLNRKRSTSKRAKNVAPKPPHTSC